MMSKAEVKALKVQKEFELENACNNYEKMLRGEIEGDKGEQCLLCALIDVGLTMINKILGC